MPFHLGPLEIGLILMVILISIGLIALIVWIIRKLSAQGSAVARHDPLDIAKDRYARGEISREEFEQIKKDLSSS